MHRIVIGASSLAIVALCACAGGDSGNPPTTAFDPSYTATDDTSPATTTTTGDTGPATTNITSADGTGTPPGSDCCEVALAPGCNNAETEACVCTIETSCCQVEWTQECVDLAGMTCGDAACEAPPGTGSGPGTTGEPPPMLTCDELAAQEGWALVRCEAGGGTQCNGMGTPTTDCDFCCELCGEPGDISCGDFSMMQGWGGASCEWNGNGACGGVGTPTCDCNACCEA